MKRMTSNRILSYKEFLFEEEFGDLYPKNKWVELKGEKAIELKKNLSNLFYIAYKNIGGYEGLDSEQDFAHTVEKDKVIFFAADINSEPSADVVISGRDTKYGYKITGIGHDGERPSKTEVVGKTADLLKKPGTFLEVSDSLAKFLFKEHKVPCVSDEVEVLEVLSSVLRDRKITWYGEHPNEKIRKMYPEYVKGWYGREMYGEYHIKILAGMPSND